MDTLIFIVILVVIFVFYIGNIRNHLNTLDSRVERNLSGVDIVLEERHNTIKKLKGLASQEQKNLREQFERLAELIEHSTAKKGNLKEYFDTENKISLIWSQTIQLPEIQQVKEFSKLSNTIINLEQEIAAARRTYNGSVERLNNGLESFPNGLIAQMIFKKFQFKEYFKATEETRKDIDMENWN